MAGEPESHDMPSPPKLPEVDSPPPEDVLGGAPSPDEVVGEQPTVDEILGRDRT